MHTPNRFLSFVAPILAATFLGAGTARALPDDQTIDFSIYLNPTDPESEVVFVVRLELAAQSSSAGQVGWDVTEIRFTRPMKYAFPDKVWVESSPVVDSPDGLWWIGHADVEDPVIGEFVMPTWLVGTATPEDPAEDDLEYDFVGVTYSPPEWPQTPPHETTAALTYSLKRAAAQVPIEEGDDEPIDVADGTNDPG